MQTTRTNHRGYDVGSSRKIPDGALALARAATTKFLEAGTPNALTQFALTLFRLLCFGFGTVKAAQKAAAAALTTRPTGSGGAPPALFQLQVKVESATGVRVSMEPPCTSMDTFTDAFAAFTKATTTELASAARIATAEMRPECLECKSCGTREAASIAWTWPGGCSHVAFGR